MASRIRRSIFTFNICVPDADEAISKIANAFQEESRFALKLRMSKFSETVFDFHPDPRRNGSFSETSKFEPVYRFYEWGIQMPVLEIEIGMHGPEDMLVIRGHYAPMALAALNIPLGQLKDCLVEAHMQAVVDSNEIDTELSSLLGMIEIAMI